MSFTAKCSIETRENTHKNENKKRKKNDNIRTLHDMRRWKKINTMFFFLPPVEKNRVFFVISGRHGLFILFLIRNATDLVTDSNFVSKC